MQLVGTHPELQPQSKNIISLISNIPLSTKLHQELWM